MVQIPSRVQEIVSVKMKDLIYHVFPLNCYPSNGYKLNYKDFQRGESQSQSIPLNSQASCWYGSRIEQ